MKKSLLFTFCLVYSSFLLYGQSGIITNNNTIIIHGNVYYFQPSSSPSSPQPTLPAQGRNFINPGSWYGENAARAWAQISDWVIERSLSSDPAIRGGYRGEIVYISQIHAYIGDSELARRHDASPANRRDGVKIYYWIVREGDRMEDGRRATRRFMF